MDKEQILEISRRENRNRDLADLAASTRAGNIAGHVGALLCCLVSVLSVRLTNTVIYSPWVIYFSILGTHYLIKFKMLKKKTDLAITLLHFAMCILNLILFVLRLTGVKK